MTMARALTADETAALAALLNPDAGETPQQWWDRVAAAPNIANPEAALAAKVARGQAVLDS